MKDKHWEIARNIAQSEIRLAKIERLRGEESAPAAGEARLLQKKIENALSSPDREEILAALPSAKEYQLKTDARYALIDETIIGKVDSMMEIWMANGASRAALGRGLPQHIDQDQEHLAVFMELAEAICSRRKGDTIQAVMNLLSSIREEVYFPLSLPPFPEFPPDLEPPESE